MAIPTSFNAAILLAEARSGDPTAVGRLLAGYQNYLLLIARMQVGRKLQGKLDPFDIVQETFLEATRQFPNFRGTTEPEFTSWLRRILAGNIALMLRKYFGTKARDPNMERDLQAGVDESSRAMENALAHPGSTPSRQAVRREQSVLLAEALERLTPDYKEVIILRHLEQLPFSEVAQKMGKTEDSVQKLWVRALKALRLSLGEMP